MILLVLVPNQTRAQADTTRSFVKLHGGAIEVNFSGSILEIEDNSRFAAAIRGGIFFEAPSGLGGVECELGYSHISALDLLDLEIHASWQRAFWDSPIYPYVALAGGLRQEWLGSFDQVRYPVGLNIGCRVLLSQQVAFRADFKLRRVLNDPVRDFSERQLVIGISVFFRNSG